MKNYEVLTCLHGMKRKGEVRSRPILPGEIVALHYFVADDLLAIGAIGETDGEATVELEDGSVDAVGEDLTSSVRPIGVVAITDRHALASAIEELGGLIFFPGEGLPDDAEQVLADFPNPQLLDELTVRLAEGRLLLTEIPTALLPPAPPAPLAPIAEEGASDDRPSEAMPPVDAASQPVDRKSETAEHEAAPAKTVRKSKATVK